VCSHFGPTRPQCLAGYLSRSRGRRLTGKRAGWTTPTLVRLAERKDAERDSVRHESGRSGGWSSSPEK